MSIEPLLKASQAAELLGVKTQTLSYWRSVGKGPPFLKMGFNVRYHRSDVEAHLKGFRIPSPDSKNPTKAQLKKLQVKLEKAQQALLELQTRHQELAQQHQTFQDLHTELEEEYEELLDHEVAGAFICDGTLAFFVYRVGELHHDERGNFLMDKGKRWKEVQTLQHATESL